MNVAVIHGTAHHGSTWHCVDIFLQELAEVSAQPIDQTEFYLPAAMPHFCCGCYSCFLRGEQACPHADSVQPIRDAILAADLIVLDSPVYAMDVSAQLKALLDHLCFLWISHRPQPAMFSKLGVAFATTAGAGLNHALATMTNSMKFWGVRRIYPFGRSVSAMKWGDVSSDKQQRIRQDLQKMARRVSRAAARGNRLRPLLVTRIFFFMMQGMMRKNTWNPTDRQHWEEQGWLKGGKPF